MLRPSHCPNCMSAATYYDFGGAVRFECLSVWQDGDFVTKSWCAERAAETRTPKARSPEAPVSTRAERPRPNEN